MTSEHESIDEPNGAERELDALLAFLHRERGFDFSGYKRAGLTRRVHQRMSSVGAASLAEYVERVHRSSNELAELFDALLINVTSFFRDPGAWSALERQLRAIVSRDPEQPLRIWSAGCSSGEEAYTLAILLRELLGEKAFDRRVKIYATDVDDDALATARQATYAREALADVPEEYLERYFTPVGDRMLLAGELRNAVVLGRHDLLRDAPIPHVDVLACRNVLIYLEAATQERVLESFRFALRPGGVLFLGRAEMLLTHSTLFTPIDLKQRLFAPESRTERLEATRPPEESPRSSRMRQPTPVRRLRARLRRANAELESVRTALRSTREQLQGTTQVLQVTNEELETTNEELEASNEELESINEELAATNEELQTINAELRQRGGELANTTALLDALLENVRSGVVVLDGMGRVQAWSPAMAQMSGIDADDALGRRLVDLQAASGRAAPFAAIAASLRTSERTLDGVRGAGEKAAYEVRLAPLGGTRSGGIVVFVEKVDA